MKPGNTNSVMDTYITFFFFSDNGCLGLLVSLRIPRLLLLFASVKTNPSTRPKARDSQEFCLSVHEERASVCSL